QLLAEMEAGVASNDLPGTLSLDQLWVDPLGRLKLLEFSSAGTDEDDAPPWPRAQWRHFLSAATRSLDSGGHPRAVRTLVKRLEDPDLRPESLAATRSQIEAMVGRLVPVPRHVRIAHLLVGQITTILSLIILIMVWGDIPLTSLPDLELFSVMMALLFF